MITNFFCYEYTKIKCIYSHIPRNVINLFQKIATLGERTIQEANDLESIFFNGRNWKKLFLNHLPPTTLFRLMSQFLESIKGC